MIPDFSQRLKNFCRVLDSEEAKELPPPPAKKIERLYNLPRRSLPLGIDVPVVFGVTKAEGVLLINDKLKVKDVNGRIIFYDFVLTDATADERDVLYNVKPVVVE